MAKDLSEDELKRLGSAFAALGAKPDFSDGDVANWVKEMGVKLGVAESVKQEKTEPVGVGMAVQLPRLPVFSGSDTKSGEVSFSLWAYEIQCLQTEGVSEAMILQAIRRSLRGHAAEVLLHAGDKVSLKTLLDKMEVVFGDVGTSEAVLEAFFSAKQGNKESVALWGCRLEELLRQARKKGAVDACASDSMLRSKFWSGIANANIKMALRHFCDTKPSFSELLRRARELEDEFRVTAHIHQQGTDPVLSKLDEILKKTSQMEARITSLEKSAAQKAKGRPRECFRCGSPDHFVRECSFTGEGNEGGPSSARRE